MIFTFYSYKGGVGRSMTVAALALAFARRGLRVLAVDFDLEAPGLERYFYDESQSRAGRAELGLIDLIQKYREALSDELAFERAEFKQLEKFIAPAIVNASSLGGSVDLMSAGRREPSEKLRDYALAVRSFDWQDFFYTWRGERFFDWLRRRWQDSADAYDVVLVDSRTGVTEMGGVCAYQLADAVVLLCAPNYQNLDGTRDVARDFVSDSVRGLRQGRELQILTVPARLDRSHPRSAEFLAAFKRELGTLGLPKLLADVGLDYDALALPYAPEYAIGEMLVNAERALSQEALGQAFEKLTDALLLLADGDARLASARAEVVARMRGEAGQDITALQADQTKSSSGYDVFLDYGQLDEEVGSAFAEHLHALGCAVFQDLPGSSDSESNAESLRALSYSAALFVCFGKAGRSVFRERWLRTARANSRIKIIPVLLPEAVDYTLVAFGLDERQALDMRHGFDTPELHELLRTLKRASERSASTEQRNPYPGRAYTESDSAHFVCDQAACETVLHALETFPLVVLEGPACVGKTSLVNAAVIPKLRAASAGPLEHIDVATAGISTLLGYLVARNAPPPPRYTLIIDGVDSLLCSTAESLPPVPEIFSRVVETARAGVSVLLVCRGLSRHPEIHYRFGELEQQHFCRVVTLEPLRDQTLRNAIEQPARTSGLLFEPGLIDRIVEGASNARGAIAQIQWTLSDLWRDRRRGWLTNLSLDALGGVEGRFRTQLRAALDALDPDDRKAVDALFLALVSMDTTGTWVSAALPWSEVATMGVLASRDAIALRDQLASQGLLDLWRGQVGADVAAAYVSLARKDPSVYFDADAFEKEREFIRWRTDLQFSKAQGSLLEGPALRVAEQWLNKRREDLLELEITFIERSQQPVEQEKPTPTAPKPADPSPQTEPASVQAAPVVKPPSTARRIRMKLGLGGDAPDNTQDEQDRAPRHDPKPEFASFWQLLRTHPLEGLRWLVFGGEQARFFHAPVRWLFGRDLIVSMRSIALYSAFGDELDHRDWMQARLDDLSDLPLDEDAFWFDFVSDTGDGQLAMYNTASLLLSDLHVDASSAVSIASRPDTTRLPRGRFVFFGGDTAYHVADTATLEKHVCTPFAWALWEKQQRETDAPQTSEVRYAFGIPGNHDYYDSLIGFNRLFRVPGSPLLPLADYRRLQRASFVALRLPFDYLFLGLDSQSGKLDLRQRVFMRRCLSEYGTGRLIVATPEPSTVFDTVERGATQAFADLRLTRPFYAKSAAFPEPEQLHLDLSGDVHHYARYADPAHPNYASVVAGGGGAFVHPTHTSHYEPDNAWPPPAAQLYPAPETSRRLITSRLLCPWRILRGGGVFPMGGVFALLVYLGVALSPDLQQHWVIEEHKSAEMVGSSPGSSWDVDSPVAQNLGRVLDRDGSAQHYRSQLLTSEWLTLLTLMFVIVWALIQSPKLFAIAGARDDARRVRVYVTRWAPLCAAALLSQCTMAATYYLVSRAELAPLRPFLANFLLFAYLAPFPLALFWVANYLASMAKQAKVRLMHAIDSAPRWIALLYGVGSAVFGLLSYGVNSVAAFATDLCAVSAVLLVAVAPMIAGYKQGHGRSLGKKLGYLALGAVFGQLQLWLPLAIATYGSAWTLLMSACAAVALATATYLLHRKWCSPWLMLGMWLLAGAASTLLALCTPALRSVNGTSATLAFVAGGAFACIWFGYYLAVSMSFGAHNNEAGGAACADHFRHFVRVKLERDRITGFVIGFDRPARDVEPSNASQSETLRAHLVETFHLTVK